MALAQRVYATCNPTLLDKGCVIIKMMVDSRNRLWIVAESGELLRPRSSAKDLCTALGVADVSCRDAAEEQVDTALDSREAARNAAPTLTELPPANVRYREEAAAVLRRVGGSGGGAAALRVRL